MAATALCDNAGLHATPMSDELELHRKAHRLRKRRLKRFLRALPRRANVRNYPVVRWFAEAAHKRPYLWSFKREHVLPAIYVGSVVALTPWPGQILLVLLFMLLLRGNLAIAVALQFVSNPFTFVPLYGLTYLVGHVVLREFIPGTDPMPPQQALDALVHADFSGTFDVLAAFLLGGLACGLVMGLAIDLTWRLLAWEARVFKAKLDALHAAAEARRIAAHRHPGHGDHHR